MAQRLRSRSLKIALGALAAFALLFVVLLGIIHTPQARRYALRQAVAILGKQGIVFQAGEFDFQLWGGRATLRDVEIRSKQHPELPPILRADHVFVDLGLQRLWNGEIHIEEARVDNPRVHVQVAKDGRDNIPRLPEGDPNAPKKDYLINRALVSGGTLRYEDQKGNLDFSLPLRQITMDGNPSTYAHHIQFAAQPGKLIAEGRTYPVNNVSADAVLRKDSLDLNHLNIGSGQSTVRLSGRIESFDKLAISGKSEATIDLSSLVDIPLTARVRTDASYNSEAAQIEARSLDITTEAGSIQGTAILGLQPTSTSKANLELQDVQLARLSQIFKSPVRIASTATGQIEASWPGLQFAKVVANAEVQLAAAGGPARDVIPVSGKLQAHREGDRTSVNLVGVRTLNTAINGNAQLRGNEAISGKVTAESADLGDTLPALEAFLGRKLVNTPVGGPLRAEVDVAGTTKRPAARAVVSGVDLRVGELDGITVSSALAYTPAALNIEEAVVTWRAQDIQASGSVGLSGRTRPLDLTLRTSELSIPTLLQAANQGDVPVSGQAMVTAQVGGTVENPTATGQLTATNLEAYGEPFERLQADVTLRDQIAVIPKLTLAKADNKGTLEASGNFNIQTRDFAVQASTNGMPIEGFAYNGTTVRGSVDLNANLQGKPDNPAGRIELAARDTQVNGKIYGNANVKADVANQVATIAASAPQYKLAANGTIGTATPYPANLTVNLNGTDLADLPLDKKLPVEGTVSGTATLVGDLAKYEAANATAELNALDLNYNGQPIRSDGPLRVSYANEVLTIERATLTAGDSRLAVTGTLPLDAQSGRTGTVTVNANVDLPSVARYLPQDQQITMQGRADIKGEIRGNLKSIDPNLTLSLRNGYFTTAKLSPPIYNATLNATLNNGALQLERATFDWGPGSFEAKGTVPLGLIPGQLPIDLPRQQGPAKLSADVRGIDLSTIEGVPEQVGGTVSAHLEVEAAKPEVGAIQGTLTFPELKPSFGTLQLEQKGVSEVRIANGTANITNFTLTGPETLLSVAGTAGLLDPYPLNIQAKGNLDAAVAAAFTEAVKMRGATRLELAVNGTAKDPRATGELAMEGGAIAMESPRVAADDVNLRVRLDGTRATIEELRAELNGGTLKGSGSLAYEKGQLTNTNVTLAAEDFYLDFPEGLKTVSNAKINLRNQGPNLLVGGEVRIHEGGFTDDLDLDRGVFAFLNRSSKLEFSQEKNPMVERVRFNIAIVTESPLVIENNLAKLEADIDVRLLGTPYEPGLSGRIELEEGGELRLQERRYAIERGVITFTGERSIEPGLDILATTQAGGFDVRLQISGTPGDTETTLTSDPPLPEPDILALLLTGKTTDDMRGQEADVARNQILSYLTGRAGGVFGRGVERVTGLSSVRIEPNLIAAESDPSARLTVGQDLSRNLRFVYSMDLVNSSDQIYIAEYDVTRRFNTRGVRQSDGSFRFDFRHDLRFGGTPEPKRGQRSEQRRIGAVNVLGNSYFPAPILHDKLNVKTGDRYDFFKIRKGLDKLDKMYAKEGMLEASVRLKREEKERIVDLALNVKPGSKIELIYEGASVPKGVRKKVSEAWQDGVFDAQRADEAMDVIKRWLVEDKHLQSSIQYEISQPMENTKRVLFDITPGPKFSNVEIVFEGAQGLEPKLLSELLDKGDLHEDIYVKPARVRDTLKGFYREQGFLDADVDAIRQELNADTHTGKIIIPVKEGLRYTIQQARFEGNKAFDAGQLADVTPIPVGEIYRPALQENVVQRLRDHYADAGYINMDADFALNRLETPGQMELVVKIEEGKQQMVREVTVEGRQNTSENLVRTQVTLKEGEPLSLKKLGESRRNLYNTGAFSLVEIEREAVDGGDERTLPMRLTVRVREIQPFQFRYGAFFDTERGPGIIADFSNRNSLGSARVLGLRTRYDSQLKEARVYFSQPQLQRFPLRTIVSPFLRRESNPATEDADPFNVDRLGFSLQQEALLKGIYLLNYGYRIEKSRTYDTGADRLFDVPLRIGSFTTTFSRETRDEILDATRGSFFSHALQFSPSWLGSELSFIKYFGQYFRYFALQKPKLELFTNELLRPRLVFATGVRVGLSRGLGDQEVPLSERFFAGGGTTIRGFAQNTVGPGASLGIPLGGEGMVVLNEELRFPLFGKRLDGVAFLDVGNVYPTVGAFSLSDLRKTGGFGL
ncbi:MAG: translocation/assembly module TamB domain-containing protein, partial [Bryobacterales bacterium]|nr:translocation/assembly module TamB domain-containing protein [Bryobacterales bacterium]